MKKKFLTLTTATTLLAVLGLIAFTPLVHNTAQASSASSSSARDDEETDLERDSRREPSNSVQMPLGRLPARSSSSEGSVVSSFSAPPAFVLTDPQPLKLSGDGVFYPQTFTLTNGLAVVVIPNTRAPIVSHMLWYQVGAADEPLGKSGLAHLTEHLMFKGTPTVPDGAFSRTIAANGGNDNAFTSWDYTAYFQNVAKDRLELVMKMEADRMANLTLSRAQVESERGVVAAERQQTTDNEPLDRLREAMRSALFVHHPYGRPIVGWADEIKSLNQDDAEAFYRTWYSPSNAVLVISGDVTADEVKPLAERTYGRLPARAVPSRIRLIEPQLDAERRVVLKNEGVNQPLLMRSYHAPSYRTAAPDKIAAIQVMTEILGGGTTSRLYRRLVIDLRVATDVQFEYDPLAYDLSTASFVLSPVPSRDLTLAETALDAVIRDLLTNGISITELDDAKRRLIDGATFARDSVQAPAYIFGMTLATGGDVTDIEKWPSRIMDVDATAVMEAARDILQQKAFVTGELQPDRAATANVAAGSGVQLTPVRTPMALPQEGMH